MTTNESSTATATRTTTMMAPFGDVDDDTDEDCRSSSPSLHSSEKYDDSDESLDAFIERYAGKKQHLTDEECDEDNKYENLDDEESVSKPVARFKLPLFEAPEFIQRLRGYNEATAGESVSFVVQFKAFPAPTVKWFKDEEEVRDTERHLLESSSSTHDGTIRLIINDVRSSDEGAYKCKVENQEGVASTTGYLSVIGDTRSRTTGRATSSRSNLGPPALSPNRAPGVSTPPILRPIVEQKSMEESEERELARQPPSPLQSFINSIRHSAKSKHPPIYYGTEGIFGRVDDDSGDGDGEDGVFDSEEDATTSSDSLEQLPIITPTSTGDDPDVSEYPSRVGCQNENHPAASADRKLHESAIEIDSRRSCAGENIHTIPVVDTVLPSPAESADVPDIRTSSSSSLSPRPAATWLETDCRASTFRQRRLGRLQTLHQLAIDLPDESPSALLMQPVSVEETESQDSNVSHLCSSDIAASVADAMRASAPAYINQSTASPDVREVFRIAQDTVIATVDNPVARFYIAFVAIAVALANFFEVQPSWVVLIVSLASFVSFHVFRPRNNDALSRSSR